MVHISVSTFATRKQEIATFRPSTNVAQGTEIFNKRKVCLSLFSVSHLNLFLAFVRCKSQKEKKGWSYPQFQRFSETVLIIIFTKSF